MPVWRMQLRSWPLWDALTNRLQAERLLDAYDIVLLDTPPALGYLTINALAAADILLVPLGASFLEFDSTGRFFDMLYSTFASIEDGETYVRGRETFDRTWAEVKDLLLASWWRDQQLAAADAGDAAAQKEADHGEA